MGLFDNALGAIGGLSGMQAGGSNALLEATMKLVNDPKIGGLAGLMKLFQQGGLGEIAKSWVSTGQNLPISPSQVQQVFGADRLGQLGAQLGVSPDQASGQLADFLPKLVDSLSPKGVLPDSSTLVDQGLSLLKGKLFG